MRHKVILCVAISVMFSASVFAGIVADCKAKYPGDYFMQKGCVDLQVDSYNAMKSYGSSGESKTLHGVGGFGIATPQLDMGISHAIDKPKVKVTDYWIEQANRLVSRYGKERVADCILTARSNEITVEINERLVNTAGAPDPRFLTERSIAYDLAICALENHPVALMAP